MRTLRTVLRLITAILAAVAKRIFHRLRHGPAVPGWSWSVELTVVVAKAFVDSTASGGDRAARRHLEAGFDPPLPRSLRDVIQVRTAEVGGVAGEWITRIGADDETSPTILYLHGGGYITGSPATHRRFVARLTWITRSRSFVPHYRLAPRHKFPAAVDDAEAVYEGLLAEGVDPARLVVAGDSAGGGLACALLQRLRDKVRPLPAGTVLFSPYTDLEHTGESLLRNAATDYLPFGEPGQANHLYLGDADPRDPLASPMYGDYTGVSPLLVFAGGREMILDDSVRLVDKARGDGTAVEFHIEDDMFHVWPALLPNHAATRRTMTRVAAFVLDRTAS